ncbi:MAG: prolipoprotein diacylglyceryl transferase [Woeseia sp.]|nr:prolipoprotein diacylglyceryl transferase [Woeseia sp.]
MIPFPNISPEIFSFSIFGIELALRWYAISYIAGFICAIFIMKFMVIRVYLWPNKNPPMNGEQAEAFISYLILGVIVGGRLGYVLFYNLEYYLTDPISILRIWDGGMSFHGGFLGVVVAVIFFCLSNKIDLIQGADLVAIASPPGLLFGRLANFINAELWGRPTDLPWGVIFPGDAAQNCPEVEGLCARHPSQIYEAGLEGLLLFVTLFILALSGAFRSRGAITSVFLIGYGGSRFFVEYFRVPDPQFITFENQLGFAVKYGQFGLTMGQLLSAPMILIGFFVIASKLLKRKDSVYK